MESPIHRPNVVTCGVVNRVMPLIAGGRKISFNKYPWLALILLRNHYHCGGTLISRYHVLTAGHCVSSYDGESTTHPKHLSVVLGAHNILNSKEHSRVYRRVKAIKVHEHFHGDEEHDVHDIALITLNREITYTQHVGPVCLPEFLDENVYKIPKGKVIGWGSENYYGPICDIPSETELNILSQEDCEKVNEYDFGRHFIEERGSMFCAYIYKRDACKV
ncbi:hypothetical protein LSTR_LSTR011937 [Laodelphax striatellus]|uniref:Peptidase S1 domain-containing protein n=1 Tax=Laodelphax striatellus TaxID=195883 RepID=A0A482WXX0_LAOST|nr:hypothetical protein LSTR_LSTR011937 [Laodelphax striatellus]